MNPTGRQLKSIGSVATSTVAAGILGIVANALIAARFGRGMATDAFFMAQSLPLIFGKFFQAGPLPQVVMPIFLEAQTRGDTPRAHRYASNILTLALVIFGTLSILLWMASPWIVRLIAAGFDEERLSLTVILARLFVPVLFCTILISLLTAFLHAFRRFTLTEWLARLPSVALIAVMVWGAAQWGVASLVWALVVGSVVQLAVLWMSVQRVGVSCRPTLDWHQPELRITWQRLAPFFLSSAAVQLQLIVHRLVTSTQPLGTLSALSYADRIVHFLGVLLGAVSMVLFPQFVQEALTADRTQFRQRLERVVILVSLVSFPVAMGLMVFSKPFIGLLLERGRFDALATQDTALALSWLAVGLFAWGLWDLCKTVAYAIQRPRIVNTTVIGASLGAMALTLTVGRWWGLPGLALSWGVVPYLMASGYLWQLRRDVPAVHRVVLNGTCMRAAVAAAGMGVICWVLRETVWVGWLARAGWLPRAMGLGLMGLGAVAGYWVLLGFFGVQERWTVLPMALRALGFSRPMVGAPVVRTAE